MKVQVGRAWFRKVYLGVSSPKDTQYPTAETDRESRPRGKKYVNKRPELEGLIRHMDTVYGDGLVIGPSGLGLGSRSSG